MSAGHVEIEQKFDVPPEFVLPRLDDVDGVAAVDAPEERQLEAVYHDTADLRLARARVTMRRRTGGPDAGWHVKLPATAGARRELHSPLGRAGRVPPKAVAAPVRGIVRDARLGPVATLRTRRLVTLLRGEDGRVLAEVADDTVTGTALAADPEQPAAVHVWRELEVELVDGAEPLLAAVAERLVAAGAGPSPSPSKLARVLGERLAALDGAPALPTGKKKRKKVTAGQVVLAALAAQVSALQDADLLVRTDQPDGVHDLRVACRRLRSILAAYRPVLDRARTEPLRDELRWVGAELSAARDGQVALGRLRDLAAAQPDELLLGPVAARLQQAAIKDAEEGRKRAARTLADARYLRLLDDLHALLDDPPLTGAADTPAGPVLADAVHRAGRRLRRRISAARDGAAGGSLHETRKAAKRVRYTAEVAAPVLGDDAAALVDCMKTVQDVLGERQDTVVTREQCRRLGLAAAAAGENAWSYGRLHALEEARAATTEAEFWRLEPGLRRAIRAATKS
ncbi:CYTH and CHAD domain-containing protein [Geodermatophilus sp. URMC 64]